jgi:polyhydroxybutyrate depolymerase
LDVALKDALSKQTDQIICRQNLPDTKLTDNSTITKIEYSNCSCGVQIIFYPVKGGGHTWPGVENTFYELIACETNEDIHARADIWNFFKQHSLVVLPPTLTK